MKTLIFHDHEIELIKFALKFTFDSKMKPIWDGSKLITPDIEKEIINDANQYDNLLSEIRNSSKNV